MEHKKRLTNIELLRIISMFLIVMNHYVVNDSTMAARLAMPFGFNKVILQCLQFGGGFGVNVFVLISGYFLSIENSPFKHYQKAIKLWLDATIYAIVLTLLTQLFIKKESVMVLIQRCFLVLYPVWWFVTAFFLLLLVARFLNKFVDAVEKKELDLAITTLVVVCSVLPTLFYANIETSNLVWFVCLYLIAARIRRYALPGWLEKHALAKGVLVYIIALFSCVLFDILGKWIPSLVAHAEYFSKRNSILILISSTMIFIGVLKMKAPSWKWINVIASSTFGVYLIHMYPSIQNTIWERIFHNAEFASSAWLIPHILISSLLVFVVSMLASMLYNITIGKIVNRISMRICNGFGKIKG